MSYFHIICAFPDTFGPCALTHTFMTSHSMNDHVGDHHDCGQPDDVGAAAPLTLSSAPSPSGCKVPLLADRVTVAILAQGTSWAVAVTQAFLLPGSIPGIHM